MEMTSKFNQANIYPSLLKMYHKCYFVIAGLQSNTTNSQVEVWFEYGESLQDSHYNFGVARVAALLGSNFASGKSIVSHLGFPGLQLKGVVFLTFFGDLLFSFQICIELHDL